MKNGSCDGHNDTTNDDGDVGDDADRQGEDEDPNDDGARDLSKEPK